MMRMRESWGLTSNYPDPEPGLSWMDHSTIHPTYELLEHVKGPAPRPKLQDLHDIGQQQDIQEESH